MGDKSVKFTFGKSRVGPHVRGTATGKRIAVSRYDTTRPPGRSVAVRSRQEFDSLPAHLKAVAKAPRCGTGMRGKERMTCGCPGCEIWREIKDRKAKQGQGLFRKAVDRLDAFLKRYWQRAADLFKGQETIQDAADTLGASQAPETVELADDLASAQDLGPEHDEPVTVGGDDLPWAAEDHASTLANQGDDVAAEVELLDESPLAKAKALQKALQHEIERLDQQLAHHLPDEERDRVLDRHLDYLIKADSLSDHISMAEHILNKGATR